MANMPVENRWTGTVGFFEYESDNHDDYDDDDWKDSNFATDYIDKNQYTDGQDALLDLVVLGDGVAIVNDPEIKVTKMPARKNKRIALGKNAITVMLKCIVFDDSTEKAEIKINKINEFVNRHDKMSNNPCYLVIRRSVSGTWYYLEFEDGSENYDRKYLQCVLQASKPKLRSYGVWEVNIMCEEANL